MNETFDYNNLELEGSEISLHNLLELIIEAGLKLHAYLEGKTVEECCQYIREKLQSDSGHQEIVLSSSYQDGIRLISDGKIVSVACYNGLMDLRTGVFRGAFDTKEKKQALKLKTRINHKYVNLS